MVVPSWRRAVEASRWSEQRQTVRRSREKRDVFELFVSENRQSWVGSSGPKVELHQVVLAGEDGGRRWSELWRIEREEKCLSRVRRERAEGRERKFQERKRSKKKLNFPLARV